MEARELWISFNKFELGEYNKVLNMSSLSDIRFKNVTLDEPIPFENNDGSYPLRGNLYKFLGQDESEEFTCVFEKDSGEIYLSNFLIDQGMNELV